MDNLLVDRKARNGGERVLRIGAGIVLEEWDRAVLGVELLDRTIDVDRFRTGIGHFTADTQRARDKLARLAHQSDLAGRFQLGGLLEIGPEHDESCGFRSLTILWYTFS